MAPRDPVQAIARYNAAFRGDGRDPAWLAAKLDRLCASPFGFLRGTFHLFAADWPTLGEEPLAERGSSGVRASLRAMRSASSS